MPVSDNRLALQSLGFSAYMLVTKNDAFTFGVDETIHLRRTRWVGRTVRLSAFRGCRVWRNFFSRDPLANSHSFFTYTQIVETDSIDR